MAWKLFYDGGCNLCHASKLTVERWAERRNVPIEVDVLQGEEAVAKGYGLVMTLETPERTYTAAEAWFQLMWLAPWYLRWLHAISQVPGIRQIMAWFYGIVVKYRYKWFGTRACQLPSKPTPRV